MTRVGVIADTHIPVVCKKMPYEIRDYFKNVNLILHAGDLVNLSVLEELEKIAPVKAVYGNMDKGRIREILPEKQIIKIDNFNIALIHNLGSVSQRFKNLRREFPRSKIDVAVFGHSHLPVNEFKNGILFLNPGSPTDEVYAPYKSVGLLSLSDKIEAQIIKLKRND